MGRWLTKTDRIPQPALNAANSGVPDGVAQNASQDSIVSSGGHGSVIRRSSDRRNGSIDNTKEQTLVNGTTRCASTASAAHPITPLSSDSAIPLQLEPVPHRTVVEPDNPERQQPAMDGVDNEIHHTIPKRKCTTANPIDGAGGEARPTSNDSHRFVDKPTGEGGESDSAWSSKRHTAPQLLDIASSNARRQGTEKRVIKESNRQKEARGTH